MRKHRLDPHIEEITELLAQGQPYRVIEDFLFDKYEINASESELSNFCCKRGLRNLIQSGRHSNPVCSDCENYMEIGTRFRKKNRIRVCKACLEEIGCNVPTSPEFCPKRKGGDTN